MSVMSERLLTVGSEEEARREEDELAEGGVASTVSASSFCERGGELGHGTYECLDEVDADGVRLGVEVDPNDEANAHHCRQIEENRGSDPLFSPDAFDRLREAL
jgi:hypothetical protein